MDRILVLSVDTEADLLDRERNSVASIENVHWLQEICEKCGVCPAYLLTYEMATRDQPISVIRPYLERGLCEVGHHLHIWTTPPMERPNAYGVDVAWIDGFQSEIPDDIFAQKMASLHKAIQQHYDVIPSIHRAGRWAIDRRTLEWLIEHRYVVDASICARTTWEDVRGVREFLSLDARNTPNCPYRPDYGDITRSADRPTRELGILEVPVTGVECDWLGQNRIKGQHLIRRFLWRCGYTGSPALSLRPSFHLPDRVFERMVRDLYASDLPVLHLMLHSNELGTGGSPKSKTPELAADIRKRLVYALETASEYGITGLPISKLPEYWRRLNRCLQRRGPTFAVGKG